VHPVRSYCKEYQNVETEMCQYLNCWIFKYLGSMSSSGRKIFDCHVYYRLWL